jgi:hypothetical protein
MTPFSQMHRSPEELFDPAGERRCSAGLDLPAPASQAASQCLASTELTLDSASNLP